MASTPKRSLDSPLGVYSTSPCPSNESAALLDRDPIALDSSTTNDTSFDYIESRNLRDNEGNDFEQNENTPLLEHGSTPPMYGERLNHSPSSLHEIQIQQQQPQQRSSTSSTSPRQVFVVNFQNPSDNGSSSGLNLMNEETDSDAEANLPSRRGSKVHEDVCFPGIEKNDKKELDYEALEEYVKEETEKRKREQRRRQRRLSEPASAFVKRNGRYSHAEDTQKKHSDSSYRYVFYSTAHRTVHAPSLAEVPPVGTSLTAMMKAGCWWLDVLSPTESEMRALGRIFGIHPLTVEDIETEEAREKCELFKNYYFICFRSFDQDHYSPTYLQPVSMYMVVMKEGILSFHFRPTSHPSNVRQRIRQLKDYITVTPDWINYAIIDDITDLFAPLIHTIEFEVDSIDELVLILKESEQSDMLRRIGHCRKKVMSLLRLLGNKADVMKGLIKRCHELRWDVVISSEIVLYLGDIQDHIITMVQSLNHYEKILSRSHSNYLAQISIEMTQANNQINDILSRLTALGTLLIPMNLVTGLWGMNVKVPGQDVEGLSWFFSILTGIIIFAVLGAFVGHRTGIV